MTTIRHTYPARPGIAALDAEIAKFRGDRVRTMRQEYDLLAANTNPTPWELRRRESLRVTLGITSPKGTML